MTFTRESDEALSIDMTPLVDCIFAIILFLLVASSFVEDLQQELPIDLPTTAQKLKVKAAPIQPIVVSVRSRADHTPAYYLGGTNKPMTMSELGGELKHASDFTSGNHLGRSEVSVVIRGDRNVKWENVADVLAACARLGITKVSTAVSIDESKRL